MENNNNTQINIIVGDILVPKPDFADKFKIGIEYIVKQSDIDNGNPIIGDYWMKKPNC